MKSKAQSITVIINDDNVWVLKNFRSLKKSHEQSSVIRYDLNNIKIKYSFFYKQLKYKNIVYLLFSTSAIRMFLFFFRWIYGTSDRKRDVQSAYFASKQNGSGLYCEIS